MLEVIEGLGPEERRRLDEATAAGRFCWIDATAGRPERDVVRDLVAGDEGALATLLDFDPRAPRAHRVHIDGELIAFEMTSFIGEEGYEPVDVRVLIHGDYLLTLHEADVSLVKALDVNVREDRSEQYLVYSVLDAMVATGYDALNENELTIGELSEAAATMRDARIRAATLRDVSANLTEMRRRLGPQRGRFDRVSEEIGLVAGLESDNEMYFDRIRGQLERLVESIDAAGDAIAKIIDLKLNEITYRLTVVATVFLPLTFLVGFFGMNFGWMVEKIDTLPAFLLLGIGLPIAVLGAGWLILRLRSLSEAAGG